MDVRCDRCQTEYELDDDSVSDAGASVQCTTCGHTFVVGRNGVPIEVGVPATPPAGTAEVGGPQAADWLLATEDGQTHRFRDLTTLQKWVVERKVTLDDRVSQKGGRWRHLREVAELAPFFDVVAQADRARSAELARRPRPPGTSSGVTPTRQTTVSRQTAAQMRREAYPDGASGRPSMRDDTSRAAVILDSDSFAADEGSSETLSILTGQRRLKIAGASGFVALAVIAAYVGFKQPHWLPFFRPPEAPRAGGEPPPRRPPAVAPPSAPTAPPPSAPADNAPPAGAAATAPPPTAPGLAAAPVIEPLPGGRSGPGERGAAESMSGAKGKSYERLVADADRLMENGQTARAQRLLDEALAIQPNGVAAVTGSAYLLLDRRKQLAAISMFKRALGFSPEYAPALFGLAEAYRAQGDLAQAADYYRKYLAVAPAGPDAPAARRQIKDLESAMPRRPAAPEPNAVPSPASGENAKADNRPAPSGE
jgi:predicted Zn finger-like uncharacterized protein